MGRCYYIWHMQDLDSIPTTTKIILGNSALFQTTEISGIQAKYLLAQFVHGAWKTIKTERQTWGLGRWPSSYNHILLLEKTRV